MPSPDYVVEPFCHRFVTEASQPNFRHKKTQICKSSDDLGHVAGVFKGDIVSIVSG